MYFIVILIKVLLIVSTVFYYVTIRGTRKTRCMGYNIFVMIYLFDIKLDMFDVGYSFGYSPRLTLGCCRDGCDR